MTQYRYQRLPFQLFREAETCLVYSTRGVAEVTDRRMQTILGELSRLDVGAAVDPADLAQLTRQHQLDAGDALEFLAGELAILRRMPERWSHWSNVQVVSDFGRPIEDALPEFQALTGMPWRTLDEDFRPQDRTLFVVALQRHDAQRFSDVYKLARKAGKASVVSSYFLGRTFVIDSLWIEGAALPCHFCQLQRLRASTLARGRAAADELGFALVDPLLQGDAWFARAELPISRLDLMFALATLRNRIRHFVHPADGALNSADISTGLQANLDEGAIVPFATMLWEACGCLAPH